MNILICERGLIVTVHRVRCIYCAYDQSIVKLCDIHVCCVCILITQVYSSSDSGQSYYSLKEAQLCYSCGNQVRQIYSVTFHTRTHAHTHFFDGSLTKNTITYVD